MQSYTFRHLDREWEATVLDAPGGTLPVRFRSAEDEDPTTYEARITREELDTQQHDGRELALRRGLESILVLEALSQHDSGLTVEEVARRTGMPAEAAEDRLTVLDSVQEVVPANGPRRYRLINMDA